MYDPTMDACESATAEAIRVTCAAYASGATEYADATAEYAGFPGLRGEVLRFNRSLPDGLPVLDLGCGGGRDARLLARCGRTVIAGDYCMNMLRTASSRMDAYAKTVGPVLLNMLALPLQTGSIGGVWASGSLLHLPSQNIPHAVSEIFRTLSPGGSAAISMRKGDGEGWRDGGTLSGRRWFTSVNPEHFSSTLEKCGFADISITDSGRQNWFVASSRKPRP